MINTQYVNIASISGNQITFSDPIKYLKAGNIITNMLSLTSTKITLVVSRTVIEVSSIVGFSSGTSAQVETDLWTGISLSKFLPEWLVSSDLEEFLNVLSKELQRQWNKIDSLPSLVDPDICPTELLPTLSESYGIPVDADDEEDVQRTFIKTSQYGFKYKGTRRGIEAAFNSLGYEVSIKEFYFGKYIGTIESVDGDTITLSGDSELPLTNGAFRTDDMICKSTGADSRIATTHPSKFHLVRSVLNPLSYVLYGGNGADFEVGDPLVTFAYNQERISVTGDWADNTLNEFPLTSSFIKVFITDKRTQEVVLTDMVLLKLLNYLKIFKSSHARLLGSGIQIEVVFLASFRNTVDESHRGPLGQINIPYAERFMYDTTDSFATRLDDGHRMDVGLSLDTNDFLSASITAVYTQKNYVNAESITLSESYELTY